MSKQGFFISMAALAAFSAAGAMTACAEEDSLVIGFSQVGHESDWRLANTESMQSTFSEENGYTLLFDDADNNTEKQITAIRNYITQGVDYIVVAPGTETGWDTVLQEAYDEGIPVIIVDRMIDVANEDLFEAWVGSDFVAEGTKAAEWLAEEFADAEELNIVTIMGTSGSSAQLGRTEGFNTAAEEHENWNLLDEQDGDFTQAGGQEVMESFLKSYEDIDVVVCQNDNEAFGAIDAITAAGKTVGIDGDIVVISFDAVKAGLERVLAGEISLNVECNPLHGPRVEEIIQKLEAGEELEKLQYVEEEIFTYDTITQEIIDGRAY